MEDWSTLSIWFFCLGGVFLWMVVYIVTTLLLNKLEEENFYKSEIKFWWKYRHLTKAEREDILVQKAKERAETHIKLMEEYHHPSDISLGSEK